MESSPTFSFAFHCDVVENEEFIFPLSIFDSSSDAGYLVNKMGNENISIHLNYTHLNVMKMNFRMVNKGDVC